MVVRASTSEPRRFRDHITTQIADLKLSCFKGNLAAFVKVRPEARAYFELKSNKLKFHFPKPGPIEGESARKMNLNLTESRRRHRGRIDAVFMITRACFEAVS